MMRTRIGLVYAFTLATMATAASPDPARDEKADTIRDIQAGADVPQLPTLLVVPQQAEVENWERFGQVFAQSGAGSGTRDVIKQIKLPADMCEAVASVYSAYGATEWKIYAQRPGVVHIRMWVNNGKIIVRVNGSRVPAGVSKEEARKVCSFQVHEESDGPDSAACACTCTDNSGNVKLEELMPSENICRRECVFAGAPRYRCEAP